MVVLIHLPEGGFMKLAQALRILLAAAAVAVSMTSFGQGPVANRFTHNWALGNGFIPSSVETSTQTFGSVSANEDYDVKGLFNSTFVFINESVTDVVDPSVFGFRQLACPVAKTALKTSANQATLSASLDASSPSCSGFGFLCSVIGCEPWGYSGTVSVSGSWHDPQLTTKITQNSHVTDNFAGTSRKENCHFRRGDASQGGFTIGANTYLFGPFASGSFQDASCNTNSK